GLAVVHVEAGGLQQLASAASKFDVDYGIAPAVRDQDGHAGPGGEVRLPPVDRGNESGEREDPRGPGPVARQPQRIAHDRAHRQPAEHSTLGGETRALPTPVVT